MKLFHVSPAFIDKAWRDGAHKLSEACEKSCGEITADQLKLMLSRGERQLIGVGEESIVGWAAIQIQQLPNKRVLYVYSIYAPGATGPEAFGLLKQLAVENGCSSIRGACNDAVSRLWERKFGAKKLYQTMEIEVQS